MTGLQKLVEWVNRIKLNRGSYPTPIAIEDKARRLLAEEEQKPTAPASLVDKIYDLAQSRNGDGCDPIWPSELLEVISCYRPVEAKARAYLNGLPDKGGSGTWATRRCWRSSGRRKPVC